MSKITLHHELEQNTEIWTANNVVINCNKKYNRFNKFMIKLVFGWIIKDSPASEELNKE